MADLPLHATYLVHTPEASSEGHDGYRWRIYPTDAGDYFVAELSGSQAVMTGLSAEQINAGIAGAVQEMGRAKLRNDIPTLEQVAAWDAPVTLLAEHFKKAGRIRVEGATADDVRALNAAGFETDGLGEQVEAGEIVYVDFRKPTMLAADVALTQVRRTLGLDEDAGTVYILA